MRDIKFNLIDDLNEEEKINLRETPPDRSFFKKSKKTIVRLATIFVIVPLLLFSHGILTEESLIKEIPRMSFWKGVTRMIIFQENLLKGELTDRTNILLLGMGGAEHEGPYLTDTIILASLKPSTNELALISFPRDLWVPIPGYGWGKINAANAIGQTREKDGSKLASMVVSNITNSSIHYFIRLDFNGFKEIIDALGGVKIEVERSFVDSMYPGPNFTYRTIRFEKDWQKMDGARALKYVRSRHGTNNENSDFARMQRQQKLLAAIKEKIQAMKIIEDPKKAWTIFNLLHKYFETNLNFEEIFSLAKYLQNVSDDKIIKKTLDLSDGSLLYSDIYHGAYILRTRSGNFDEIALLTKNVFKKDIGLPKIEIVEKPKIIVLNGTYIEGLARTKSNILSADFRITEIGNAEQRDYQETIIYDLTNGKMNKELSNLKRKLNTESSSTDIPVEFSQKKVDFVVILGAE